MKPGDGKGKEMKGLGGGTKGEGEEAKGRVCVS